MISAEGVHDLAKNLGFDLVGIAPALPSPETEFLREWVERGYAGEMGYIERRVEERVDPRRVLEGARSVISVGLVYDPGAKRSAGGPWIARYAGGDDYHDVLGDRLEALVSALEAWAAKPIRTRAYVDTGPVQERVFAAYGGLGWIGKNTCLIHPRLGSYLFLGVVLTDLDLPAGEREPDHCGTCRACLDVCPTDAFVAPYVLDATRCISYTTIESRESIPLELRDDHGGHVFGCDLCQEVCPWNLRRGRSIPEDGYGLRKRLHPRESWQQPTLSWLLGLDEEAWRSVTRGTALRRTKYRGLLRNAMVAAGNSGDRSLIPQLERLAHESDPMLAEHANWALGKLQSGLAGDQASE